MKAKKAKTKAKKGQRLKQVGALPFRREPDGELRFLLLTSRGTKRFIIPKGWQMKELSDAEAAAEEARQEAGVVGAVAEEPIGSYFYWKRLKNAFVPITVDVYPLEVHEELRTWKERGQRLRNWLSADQAMALVDEPQLIHVLETAEAAL
ncbi:MAG: NUDIX hydrolase [Rhizobiaceae bacterium]|jgi:8-oxo-dGTP pyrophosphatase MutT (NUDIX family)